MKLSDIDPDALALEVHDQTVNQAWRLAGALSFGGVTAEPVAASPNSEVRRVTLELARYAQTGRPPEGDPDPKLVAEYLQSLGEILWTGVDDAVYQTMPYPWDPSDGGLERELDVMLCAAVGRHHIATSRLLTMPMVASLAGLSIQGLRNLIAKGELQTTENPEATNRRARYIEPDEAQRWLAGRGVLVGAIQIGADVYKTDKPGVVVVLDPSGREVVRVAVQAGSAIWFGFPHSRPLPPGTDAGSMHETLKVDKQPTWVATGARHGHTAWLL